ncbi:elongation factor P--(R)-beta-lysine ligase [Enterobacteriaceae endosymbiont of Donacia bicoloricornis]|uniref:elongation factor P--(R)-beta-lysine ligase n=1 Tax=Enterobacteriaceae endosymbiont of Donacia bicoloricornis TaxID=2675772 RepID=UPI00144962CC|nr:elongation factor P--(R)-beta-lysine ligase [Enterobacteriaceae endosymbiont of Donacia bicoloricornis]QJC37707.1 elongation factor P--(R)-beta-lysine ligase [Enterobacteriaceae endosymbiont of Donacia bicoloricornis]
MKNLNYLTSANINVLIKRAIIIKKIRKFFDKKNFIEVETPILTQFENTSIYLKQFSTNFINNKNKKKLFLITSPEFHMKRIIASKINASIYQICHSFRNSELGQYHNPEFTILEWYHKNYNLKQLMKETNNFFIKFGFHKPKKYSYKKIFLKYLKIDPFHINQKKLLFLIKKIGFVKNKSNTLITDDYLQILFDLYIVPKLGIKYPVLIYNFPSSQKTTETINIKNKNIANRFEIFFKGVELGNGFHELTNYKEQKKRFNEDNKKRKLIGLPIKKIDTYLLKAIKYGIPNYSGMAIGLDRFIMFLLKKKSIHKSISFSIKNA